MGLNLYAVMGGMGEARRALSTRLIMFRAIVHQMNSVHSGRARYALSWL